LKPVAAHHRRRLRKELETRCRLKVKKNVKVKKNHDCLRLTRNNYRRPEHIACEIAYIARSRVRCVRHFLPLFTAARRGHIFLLSLSLFFSLYLFALFFTLKNDRAYFKATARV